ncbi:MAG TPA: hypothetical protein VFB22_01010 [Candidatus Baltobacteraceae bacterium]|nr:hypothetical protein [Candidatus Baltobacteraceae bacterium]
MIALDVPDLRSAATPAFEPAVSVLPPGVSSPFGPQAPFGSPAFADGERAEITPRAALPPPEPIPGRFVSGSLWTSERFQLRIPERWNGRLVVAGCPGQRTEFASDRIFADPLLERGYAYVCGNKGNGDGIAVLERGATFAPEGIPLPRFFLPDGRSVVFWQHGRDHRLERWGDEMLQITATAQQMIADARGRAPEAVYAIGLSNGGYEVRRAIELSDVFAGAVTWNPALWTVEHNPLRALIGAVAAMQAGRPHDLAGLGFPPDVVAHDGSSSLYRRNFLTYWHVTAWLHAMNLDPEASIAYGDVDDPHQAEAWAARIAEWRFDRSPAIAERVARYANTGRINCKLIEVSAEYDHLLPPAIHHEPYGRLVAAAGKTERYRGRVVPRAQHVDAWSDDPKYPDMRSSYGELIEAWDEMLAWVGDPG